MVCILLQGLRCSQHVSCSNISVFLYEHNEMIPCHNFIRCCNLLMHSHYQNQIGLQQRIWRDEDTSFGPSFESNTFGNHGKPGDTLESTMETWGMDSAVVFLPWTTINKTSIHTISIEPGHFFGATWKRWPLGEEMTIFTETTRCEYHIISPRFLYVYVIHQVHLT